MPTYEYACRDCGEHLEIVQSFKDAPLTECGRCGGTLRKVFSAAGIIFKGSGYYVTDSRKAASGSSAGPSDGGSGGSSSDSAKSDGKSDAKSASTDSTPSTSSDGAAKSA